MAVIKSYEKTSKQRSAKEIVDEQNEKMDDLGIEQSMTDDGEEEYTISLEGINIDEDAETEDDEIVDFYENLVKEVDKDVLKELGQQVITSTDQDEQDRSEWMNMVKEGFQLLGLKIEELSEPFEGACSAQHPLLLESAVKFQSKASSELLPASGPVKTLVLGDFTPEKEAQSLRVKNHMNYQVTELMTEFYPDSERSLLYLPLVGSTFKKTYYDAVLKRPVSELVTADCLVVPNNAPDLFRAERYTHIIHLSKLQFDAACASGLYEKADDDESYEGNTSGDDKAEGAFNSAIGEEIGITVNASGEKNFYTLYEQHVNLYIEGLDEYEDEEYKEYCIGSPYIITVDAESGCVVGLRRNWDENDEQRKKKVIFTHYVFVPGFGFYGLGFLHLLGNLQLSLTSSLRSLVDSGQFSNMQGGFKLKGTRIMDDGTPFHPGQFKDLDSPVNDISKAIYPMSFKEPSAVLFEMLKFLDTKGQKFADSTEQVIADSTNYGPVGTTMALLDASTKFFGAIHKRLHNSQKHELNLIADINKETLDSSLEIYAEGKTLRVSASDYSPSVGIVPVSDPNISSAAHRMTKAQALLTMAQTTPNEFDMQEVVKHILVNMDYGDPQRFLKKQDEAVPQDPMSDILATTQGKPIKAFPGQDHKSHIAIKQSFLQDPTSGGNPAMQRMIPAILANIQEHIVMDFQEQMQASGNADPTLAAQQVAKMNFDRAQAQAKQSQDKGQDQAAILLAQAELKDSETKAREQAFQEDYKKAQHALDVERLKLTQLQTKIKANEFKDKQQNEIKKIVTSKGIDAITASLAKKESPNKTSKGK